MKSKTDVYNFFVQKPQLVDSICLLFWIHNASDLLSGRERERERSIHTTTRKRYYRQTETEEKVNDTKRKRK